MLPVLSAPLHKITVPFNVIQEPYNLKGVHSFRYNGLIKKKAIDLQSASDGKGVTFRYKKSKGWQKPNKAVNTTLLKGDGRKVMKTVSNFMESGHYNPRHVKLAKRRASRILLGQKPASVVRARNAGKRKAAE